MCSRSRVRSAEERLRMAEIAGGIATFELDYGTSEWQLSEQLWGLLDISGRSTAPTFGELTQLVFPDDLLKIEAAAQLARAGGTFQAEFRVRRTGGVRWIEGRGRTAPERGAPRLWGAFYDITERKVLQARLLRAQRNVGSADHRTRRGNTCPEGCSIAPARQSQRTLSSSRSCRR